jgi:pimeloyl-ACP methyl ester carboxylesterase
MNTIPFENFTRNKVEANGVRLHYRAGGTGQTVLLLHGWMGTSYTWRKVAPVLAQHYQVIVPDLRGYGDSDKPLAGYDGLTLVEDLRQLLQTAGVREKVHVVGWDMGALPAFLYAAHHPREVASLVYLDEPLPGVNLHEVTSFRRETFGGYWHFGFNAAPDLPELLIGGREREWWNYLYGLMLHRPDAITEADKDEYLRTYATPGGIRGSLGWYRDALTTVDQFVAAMAKGKLSVPVLAYGGQYGVPYTKDQLVGVADKLAGGIIPGCGHMVAEEAPDFLSSKLLSFFN